MSSSTSPSSYPADHPASAWRPFALGLLAYLLLYVAGHYALWKAGTERLLTERHGHPGDLARIGYLPGMVEGRVIVDDLPRRHIEGHAYDGRRVDLLTIGDSYSNGEGHGRNRYYQDYLATNHDIEVLNLQPYPHLNEIETVALLERSGYLERLGVPRVLVECAERLAPLKLGLPARLDGNVPLRTLAAHYASARYDNALPPASFLNTGNLKLLLFQGFYLLSDHALVSRTYVRALRRPLFTGPAGSTLLFYAEDLEHLRLATPERMATMNDNLNELADLLARSGRRLTFMPAVDKYTLYAGSLDSCPYPRSRFFELIRSMPRHYELLDTKAVLEGLVATEESDIFYGDDSHWSYKASEAIAAAFRPEPSISGPVRLAAGSTSGLRR